jgi:hypothetical protein
MSKEIRVYVVCDEDSKWAKCSNEEFVAQAEQDGTVWSLRGFAYLWNNFAPRIYLCQHLTIRILQEDVDGKFITIGK